MPKIRNRDRARIRFRELNNNRKFECVDCKVAFPSLWQLKVDFSRFLSRDKMGNRDEISS